MKWLLNKVKAAFAPIVARCAASTTSAPVVTTPHSPSPLSESTSQENEIPKMSKSEQPRPASEKAYKIIEKWEGYSAEPYLCSAEVPTIGWGTTVYPNGLRVSLQDPEITEAQARQYLRHHVQKLIEPDLTELVGDLVNQNQYDALVSFCYNIGMGPKKWQKGMKEGFRQSTMLKKILARDFKGAAEEFPKWRLSGGKVTAGLINRRKDERHLFELDPYA